MSTGEKIAACCLILFLPYLSSYQLAPCALSQSMTYQADRSKTIPPSTAPETFVPVGQTKLHYIERGQGRPVVMIHGNAGDLHDFEFGTFDLLARSYRAIAFDLPGHGLSKESHHARGTIQEQAKILHQALTAMGVKEPILVGHSWGGAIALAYALLYPHEISALVLLAPAAYSDRHHDAPAAFLLHLPLLSDFCIATFKPFLGRKLLRKSLNEAFSPDPVPADYWRYASAVWLDRKRLKAFIREDFMVDASLQKLSPQYGRIHTPVVIVSGDSDLTLSPQQNAFRLQQAIAKSELIIIPHAGHEIPEMHPDVVLRAVGKAALAAPLLARKQND
jgi:pimeloyl-ACP methyl ester carboxylesterase